METTIKGLWLRASDNKAGGREAGGCYGLIRLSTSNIILTFGVVKRLWFIIVYCSI